MRAYPGGAKILFACPGCSRVPTPTGMGSKANKTQVKKPFFVFNLPAGQT